MLNLSYFTMHFVFLGLLVVDNNCRLISRKIIKLNMTEHCFFLVHSTFYFILFYYCFSLFFTNSYNSLQLSLNIDY